MCQKQPAPLIHLATPPELAFGQVLSQIVPVSRHDIYDILEEQSGSRLKFGQLALARGLCQPSDIWQAWTTQLVGRTPTVDLQTMGIDAQAIDHLSGEVAAALSVIPIRSTGYQLVIAASQAGLARVASLLPAYLKTPFSLVIADSEQIQGAIARYYPTARPGRAIALNQASLQGKACNPATCLGKCRANPGLAVAV